MKKVKLTYYLVMLLSLISLVSVGFASWTVTDDFSTTASGMIVVDDVMKVNDYITCSSNVKKFGFFKTGFVDEAGKVSNVGTIETTLTVNIANCKKKFPECNTLEIDLSLESTNIGVFISEGNSTISLKISDITNGNDKEIPINEDYLTSSEKLFFAIIDINNFQSMASPITLKVVYTFTVINTIDTPYTEYYKDAPYANYFASTIYPVLLRENFNFVLSAKLTGKVVS